jgi:MbtH protein
VATNPFEDPDAKYLVLINDEGQHSLWPVFADVPDGWEVIFGEDGRQECLDFIEANWTDMRPNSLIRQMEADAAARQGATVSGNGASGNGASGNGASGNGASGNGPAAQTKPNGSRAAEKEAASQNS